MAFTSMQFVMFLVLAVAVYYLMPKRYRWVTLLVVNYVFYYFAGVKYFVYLFATTISTYIATMKLGNMTAENKAAYNAVILRRKNAGFWYLHWYSTSVFWQC